jgi:hypothetical protein
MRAQAAVPRQMEGLFRCGEPMGGQGRHICGRSRQGVSRSELRLKGAYKASVDGLE